jgi:hypothetical protein
MQSLPPALTIMLPNGQPSVVSAGPASPYDGLGDADKGMPGIAIMGPWWPNGAVRVFIYTGDAPEPYGYFTLTIPTAVVPAGKRPICVATAMWTNADYASGYANPVWPFVFIQQHEYNITGPQVTQSFLWQTIGFLQPRSAYTVNVICSPKS